MDDETTSASSRAPWRCQACGYDARAQSLGEPCAECGTVLGERSLRPAWLDAAQLASMRRLAMAGACLGLPTILIVTALATISHAMPGNLDAVLGVMLYGFTVVGLIAQAVVGAKLAVVGLDGARANWMGLAAVARPFGAAVLIGLVFGFPGVVYANDPSSESISTAAVVLWAALYLGTLVLIAVADIALMVRFGRFRRPLALATTNWHTAAFIARVLLLLPTYLVAMHPFFGWAVAPIAWNALAVFTFALLWWDLTAAARRGVD